MTTDPSIRQRTYQYFLQEAPELLQTLEQGLRHFKDDRSINQVHHLLRATHTLKGAANSVGLETIATVAHSLEDIFKSLCNPEAVIDPEVEALLFEGFECLRLPLTAELTGGTINQGEILDRTATIFAQLQEKLGDCFDQQAAFPSSEELGFDIIQSIFEVGVAQRLQQLATSLVQSEAEEVAALLRTQAEVFLGISESLKLPGFGAIAQATIAALNHHPDQVMEIAQQAIADFQQGQAAVLAGDRTQGGQPSHALQRWANLAEQLPLTPTDSEAGADTLDLDSNHPLMESIWGEAADRDEADLEKISSEKISSEKTEETADDAVSIVPSPLPVDGFVPSIHPPSFQSPIGAPTPIAARATDSPPPVVRVDVKDLDHLNYSIGELLTNQNYQSLQAEQLQSSVRSLLSRLKHHQQILNRLQVLSDRQSRISAQLSAQLSEPGRRTQKQGRSTRRTKLQSLDSDLKQQLDSLQLEQTTQLTQALLEDIVQITETVEAVDLFAQQANQTLEKQRQLLTNTRNALIEARMLPMGTIFNRFPHVLQQLETLHNKQITLSLQGTEVLVDKAIAERLYDPLLHLVRNAFDHGIEPPTMRQQSGKPDRGQIAISAYNQGKYLVIEVQDDGKGLDFDQIRQCAVAQHLISLEQALQLSAAELIEFLFETGFSTANQISDLSGRGIGLDAVRNQINALQGSITVHSKPHQGTTFTLQIPLNLTIAPLLVCEANSRIYAFLDDAIEQILIPQAQQIQERNHCKVLQWRKGDRAQLVPLHSLTAALNYHSPLALSPPSPTKDPIKPILLLRHHETFLGLEVDRLVGEQELVIRPLSRLITAPDCVHGASILADGSLALVLDGTLLLQTVLAQPANPKTADYWGRSSDRLPAFGDRTLTQLSEMTQSIQREFAPPSPPFQPQLNRRSQPLILITEDSITTRQALALTLEKFGYQVLQAPNGQEAIEQLQRQPHIQLVICDIEMPVMNGFEFLRRSQQMPELANIPILILSSRSDEKHRSLAAQLGATAYMTKPYIEYKLLSLVTDLLERKGVGLIL
jgi:two-component system, chemotaxis family, sensor histidine kinase and response regulator PixL